MLCVALLLVACGCEATLRVDVSLGDSGAGTVEVSVEVDDVVLQTVPEIADGLRLDDLAAGGWTVGAPRVLPGGGAVVTATKEMLGPDDVAPVLAEIDPDLFPGAEASVGIIGDRRDHRLAIEVDPRFSPDDLSDAELSELLGGAPLGRDAVEADLTLEVSAAVPGAAPVTARWRAGDPPDELVVSASVTDADATSERAAARDLRDRAAGLRDVLVLVAIVGVLALALVAVVSRRSGRARDARDAVGTTWSARSHELDAARGAGPDGAGATGAVGPREATGARGPEAGPEVTGGTWRPVAPPSSDVGPT